MDPNNSLALNAKAFNDAFNIGTISFPGSAPKPDPVSPSTATLTGSRSATTSVNGTDLDLGVTNLAHSGMLVQSLEGLLQDLLRALFGNGRIGKKLLKAYSNGSFDTTNLGKRSMRRLGNVMGNVKLQPKQDIEVQPSASAFYAAQNQMLGQQPVEDDIEVPLMEETPVQPTLTPRIDWEARAKKLGLTMDQVTQLQIMAGLTGNAVDGKFGTNTFDALKKMGFVGGDNWQSATLNGNMSTDGFLHNNGRTYNVYGAARNGKRTGTYTFGNSTITYNTPVDPKSEEQTQTTPDLSKETIVIDGNTYTRNNAPGTSYHNRYKREVNGRYEWAPEQYVYKGTNNTSPQGTNYLWNGIKLLGRGMLTAAVANINDMKLDLATGHYVDKNGIHYDSHTGLIILNKQGGKLISKNK